MSPDDDDELVTDDGALTPPNVTSSAAADEPVTDDGAPTPPYVTSSPKDVPYRFDRTDTAADLHEQWADLPPGVETGETASVAGRLMLRRDQGKVAFGTLADSSGRIQLFARAGERPGSTSSPPSRWATGSASPARS